MAISVLILATILSLPLTGITQNSASIKPVSLTIPVDPASSYVRHVNFYNETFNEFYTCLCQTSWGKCILNTAPDPSHPYRSDDIYVTSVGNDNQFKLSSHLDYFECKYDQSTTQLFCERFTASCNSTGYVSFRFCNSSSCDTGCARILSNRTEKLLHSNTDKIQDCNVSCDQTTTSITHTASSALSVQFTLTAVTNTAAVSINQTLTPISVTNTAAVSINQTTYELTEDQTEDNKVPIIIGAVCGGAFVIIVTIIGVVLWRRKRSLQIKQENYQNSSLFAAMSSDNENKTQRNLHSPDVQIQNSTLSTSSILTVASADVNVRKEKTKFLDSGRNGTQQGYTEKTYTNMSENGSPEHGSSDPTTKDCDGIEHHYEILQDVDPYNNVPLNLADVQEEESKSRNVVPGWSTMKVVDDHKDNELYEICNHTTQSSQAEDLSTNRNYENAIDNDGFKNTPCHVKHKGDTNTDKIGAISKDPYYNYIGIGGESGGNFDNPRFISS